MPDPVAPLVLDLLEWVGPKSRPYREVIDAWRTSCPRLPVWETANEQGFLDSSHVPGQEAMVILSPQGVAWLASHRQAREPAAEPTGLRLP